MDAARTRLIELLYALVVPLSAGEPLARCLRRLPRRDWQALCAPLAPVPRWGLPRPRAQVALDEAWLLARLALAAGGEAPEQLAARLSELARDLEQRP